MREFPRRKIESIAHWWPLYVEPMTGSGEKITIAVVAKGENEFFIAQAKGLSRLNHLYGEGAKSLLDAISVTLECIEEILLREAKVKVQSSMLPFDGFQFGAGREGSGVDIEQIATDGLRLTSSLYLYERPKMVSSEQVYAEKSHVSRTKLEKDVMNLVIKREPKMRRCFGVHMNLPNIERKIPISFVSDVYVANMSSFGKVSPFNSLPSMKSRLWDLEYCRDTDTRMIENIKTYAMIIENPLNSAIFKDRKAKTEYKNKMEDAIGELKETAARQNINILTFFDPVSVADHLVDFIPDDPVGRAVSQAIPS